VAYGQIKQNIDKDALALFKARLEKEKIERDERVKAYLMEHPSVERVSTGEDGSIVYLKDIQFGQPVFVQVDNKGAAETTGASVLSSTGEFGIDLQGEGMKIGVWDGGYNLFTHQEYGDRTTIGDGNEFGVNFHASHVMGTILAAGINDRARGMAPKARGVSYGFSNDLSEMTTVATTETDFLILSNHSYGVRAGWNDSGDTWLGDPDVSDQEDWRFGYYNSDARNTDQLMYLAPYYLSVWSAGNQRGRGGNGPYPANGPYDILVGDKNAKNTLIVGAVNKINGGYNEISDVVMSSFSCWGPTDDGRIKPDIVGAGVSIFSTLETADDAYGNLQGTSMSAPNVSGSLILIQELNARLNAGNFLKSATMKSLIFHTANDGGTVGPDYAHGWGVLNVQGMADLMVKENNDNVAIRELVLINGENYQIDIDPKANTEVKATIVWTDLPGEPGPSQTVDGDKLMLINDLDMRISDGSNTYMPWILDPANPGAAATTGDNFRDNSEQVVFTSTDGAPLTLTISHKGELETGSQAYSLVLTYTPKNEKNTYYWIGEQGGAWNDGSNWSLSSGGEAANAVPGAVDMVIFDDRSFANDQTPAVAFNQDRTVAGIKWLAPEEATLNLGGFQLSLASDFVLDGNVTIGSGTIELLDSQSPSNKIVSDNVDLSEVDFVVNSPNTSWRFVGDWNVNSLTINAGSVDLAGAASFELGDLITSDNKEITVNAAGVDLTINGNFGLSNTVTWNDSEATTYLLQGDNKDFVTNNIELVGDVSVAGLINFGGSGNTLSKIDVKESGEMHLASNYTLGTLVLVPASTLSFEPNVGVEIIDDLQATGTADKLIVLRGSLEQSGFVQIDGHRKICLDFLAISDVDLSGSASVTAGVNSTTGNNSWPLVACEDVLFSDFSYQYICLNSLTQFTDASTGGIVSWTWDFGDGSSSTDQNPSYVYAEAGTYEVKLTVQDDITEKFYTQTITIGDNDLSTNTIVNNDGILASVQQADQYQWYRDGELLSGATERTYDTQNENGIYFVVTFSEDCNLKSNEIEVVISSIEDEITEQFERATNLSPNPSDDQVRINMVNEFYGSIETSLIDLTGKQYLNEKDRKTERTFNKLISIANLPRGVYIVNLLMENGVIVKKKLLVK
jgi:PKD repeat protein